MPLRTQESSDSVPKEPPAAHVAPLPHARARGYACPRRLRHGSRAGRPRRRARRVAGCRPRLGRPRGAARASTWSASTGRAPAGSGSGQPSGLGASGPGAPRSPKVRMRPTPGATSSRRATAGTSATPGGPAEAAGSSTGSPARSPAFAPSSSRARSRPPTASGSPPPAPRRQWRPRAGPSAAADRAPCRLERRRVDRPRRTLDRRRASASPSSTTRPGSNSYSPAESAAIVRGDPALPRALERLERHRLQLPRRQVRPGLRGSRRWHRPRTSIGAHAGGFNTGSVGVAVIGNYESAALPAAARAALEKLLAWRLDVGHVHPRGHWTAVSAGSSRWPAGASVRLRAVSGHRDTSLTSCPGNAIYGKLGRSPAR